MPAISYVALGSNLNNPIYQLTTAIEFMKTIERSALLNHSSFYQTQAVGPIKQANYVNAVAKISTYLKLHELHSALQSQEIKQKRQRAIQWAPRTLDLDILYYDGLQAYRSNTLEIPHPRLLQRLFVLIPLAEIDPEFKLHNGKYVREQIAMVPHQGQQITRLPICFEPVENTKICEAEIEAL